jgi:hypothetical protein
MITHLYTLCWNEADILGFFFRHYDPWIDHYIVFDDGSTDQSLEMLTNHPRVELRKFEREVPDSFVLSQQQRQNQVWKESRGQCDWVIITAIDEHLWLPGCSMLEYLQQCTQQCITLVPALGYQMVSEEFPAPDENLCQTRTWGAPWIEMNKLSVFNPNAIAETNFAVGRHTANPVGDLKYPDCDQLLLLHYKYLDFERLVQRHALQQTGLGSHDIANCWGFQYGWEREQLRQMWNQFAQQAIDLSQPNFDSTNHSTSRWWRETT